MGPSSSELRCPGLFDRRSARGPAAHRRPSVRAFGPSSPPLRSVVRHGDQPSTGWRPAPAPALGGLCRCRSLPLLLGASQDNLAIVEGSCPRCCRTATSWPLALAWVP